MQESFKKNKIPYLVPQLEDLIQIGTISIYHNGIRVSINHFEVHLNETNHFEKQNPSIIWVPPHFQDSQRSLAIYHYLNYKKQKNVNFYWEVCKSH